MSFLNPHSKHGYIEGNTRGLFWRDLEDTYATLQKLLTQHCSAHGVGSLVIAKCRYGILRHPAYYGFSQGTTVDQHLKAAIKACAVALEDEDEQSPIAALCEGLLLDATKEAANQLLDDYKATVATPMR